MGTQPGTNWARHRVTLLICQWCFDAVGWVAGRASGLKNWKVNVIDDSMWVHYMAWRHSGQGVVQTCIWQLMSLPLTVSCFSKILIGFIFLVLAYPGSPRNRAIKWVCVCVCACVLPLCHAAMHW